MLLFNQNFLGLVALLNDEDAVFGVHYADTLQIVINSGSVVVVGDAADTGILIPHFQREVTAGVPVLAVSVNIGTGVNGHTYPYCSLGGELELYVVAVQIGIVDEAFSGLLLET